MPDQKDDDSVVPRRARVVGERARERGAGPGGDPVNEIEWVAKADNRAGEKKEKDEAGRRKGADKTAGAGRHQSADAAAPRAPDSVHERFIQIGNKFYFPDGQDAFAREGNRLTTRSENAIVIQSMVAIARADSGNGEVTVKGSDFFRKEVWFAGSLAGLEVKGYQPTDFERERLVRAIAARGGRVTEEGSARREAELDLKGPRDPPASSRSADNELIVGRLVDHGPAPYQHNPKEQMSYFVRIETARGDRDIWGSDLERAFRHSLSTPGIGDEIGLRAWGKEAVTVLAPQRDAKGQEIGRETLATHRNQWSVERVSFLKERHEMAEVFKDPSVSESEAIKRHPELEGSYLQLQSGQALANEQYTHQGHRDQFVEHLRSYLARNIEQGRPLEPVRLRERGGRAAAQPEPPDPERWADRDNERTR